MEDNLLYFQDEAGQEIGLMLLNQFDFEGDNYALLADPNADPEHGGVYVMHMDEKDGELAFAMPTDEEMEKLIPFVGELLEHLSGGCTHDCCSCHGCHHDEEEDDGCGCGCGDGDCGCGHDHH